MIIARSNLFVIRTNIGEQEKNKAGKRVRVQ
jgi:hypothetical protein